MFIGNIRGAQGPEISGWVGPAIKPVIGPGR